jgi:acyl-CoA thioesterase FadM
MSVEFLRPMSWDDELEITVEVAEVREHAVVFTLAGRVGGNETLKAQLTLVCVSTRSGRPVPVPDWFRSALQAPRDS